VLKENIINKKKNQSYGYIFINLKRLKNMKVIL